MKVLHLVKTGSGAKWALIQMRELAALGLDVHVALPPGALLESDYCASGIAVHRFQADLPARRPPSIPTHLAEFRALVEEVKPDIIHSHFVGTTLTMRLALGKSHSIPRVFQVPGPLHLEHPVTRRVEVHSAGPSDYWFGACEWTCRRYIGMGIDSRRVFLRYYGKYLEDFSGSHRSGKLRDEIGLPVDAAVAGMVAYMYPPKRYLGQRRGLKGHEDFIDALKLCVDRGLDVYGVIVGKYAKPGHHPYEDHLRSYGISKLGSRIAFLGKRTDVPELYPDFTLAVHPSHSENLGGAAESLLLGVPTIATNVGGFPDIVVPHVTGLLVPPKDPSSIADAIAWTLANPEDSLELAAAGRNRAAQLLNARLNAAMVRDSYKQILGSAVH